eukprot:425781_1
MACAQSNQYDFRGNSCNDVTICNDVKQLTKIILQYNAFINKNKNNELNGSRMRVSKILAWFLHSLQKHDENEEFDFIVKQLGSCDLVNCTIFRRNRDKNKQKQNYENTQDLLYFQTMDKIHCYYQHSYDIGHRSKKESNRIITEIHNDDTSDNFNYLINNYKPMKTHKKTMTERYNNKFNQFLCDNQQNNNLYSSGREMIYKYPGEHESNYDQSHRVEQRWKHLKQELIQNEICSINKAQFKNEYNKATVHLDSRYRRTLFREMNVEHILSMMIYCNFDELQNLFSKTYRQNIKQHDQFYHMGKFIKMCIHSFGIKANANKTGNKYLLFYHGMQEKLLFRELLGVDGKGVVIHCPLSTSSSFAVATNFTNNENGLIIVFGGISSSARYFSCKWLSDFANESEMLFVQNHDPLQINDIVDPHTLFHFNSILKVINTIDNIISTKNRKIIKTDISLCLSKLITKIIDNQLG